MTRSTDQGWKRVQSDGAFDVIVVGGGINGIGAFRDLALQGLRVLLVEREDFCSGCSAAPSRMIHGGLRYLENGEFFLVQESLRERDALLANAPHMVRPLPTTIPITSIFSGLLNGIFGFFGLTQRPASRGALPIKIGLSLYDWTTRQRRRLPKHSFRNARETFHLWPKLTPRLQFSATYYDAWISHPERLGVELLLDSARDAPESVALNHAEIVPDGAGYKVLDHLTGEEAPVTAKVLVNATGAWLDHAISMLDGGKADHKQFVSGTKGSHLILDNPELHDALGGHMIFFENKDGRVCIVFPYLGKVLTGATDIRVEKAERVRCEPEERDYIVAALGQVFPEIEITKDQVVYSFSGIRPLPKSDQAFTGRISRGHFVHRLDGEVPQFCMVGGKWTTFRAFSEQTTDAVLAELGKERKTSTLNLPIGGGARFPGESSALEAKLLSEHAISPERAAYLADVYGTRAGDVLAFCAGRDDDLVIEPGAQVTGAEIAFLIRHEFAETLGDILLRRLPLAITGEITLESVMAVAKIAARELGRNADTMAKETEGFLDTIENYYGVSRETLEKRTDSRSKKCA